MSSFIRPKRPITEKERGETSRLFGDLLSKIDAAHAVQLAPAPEKKSGLRKVLDRVLGHSKLTPGP